MIMPKSYLLYKVNNVTIYIVLSFCLALSAYISMRFYIHLNQFKKQWFRAKPKFDSGGHCTDHNLVNMTNSVTYSTKRGKEVCPLHFSTKLPLFKFEHSVEFYINNLNRLSLFFEKSLLTKFLTDTYCHFY